MRFLLLTEYYPPEVGAAQTRLAATARCLREAGHEVLVVTALPNYPKGRVFDAYRGRRTVSEAIDGITVRRTWVHPHRGSDARRLLTYLSFQASSLPVVMTEVRRRRPDYLLIESPPLFLGLTGILLRRLLGVPYIFNVADLWPDWAVAMGAVRAGGLQHRVAARLESWIYRRAAAVTAVTRNIGEAIRAKGVDSARILFLPNGVDLEAYDGTPQPSRLAAQLAARGEPIALYAGTLGTYHGLDVALDAARLLQNQSPVRLVFVGDGAERDRLQEQARSAGLDNVEFHDPVPVAEIPALLAAASVALSVIRIPTRAAKVMPAMAAGKPIVYSGAGEGADLVREAGAGLVVPPGEPEALADAIARVIADPALAARLGRAGRRYAGEHLSWRALVRDWSDQLAALGPKLPPGRLATESAPK